MRVRVGLSRTVRSDVRNYKVQRMDQVVIAIYVTAMIAIGWMARRRVRGEEDFLVAGRRLGPWLYGGTLAAVVLGGASTIGGVGLGYQYGLSGMWLVFSIGCGIILISLLFAGRINRIGVYTVSEMLELRYGPGARLLSGLVMCIYALLLCVVATLGYGTILSATFGVGKVPTMIAGGAVVIIYSLLGGMWSITLTDFVQFIIKTLGIFVLLLPLAFLSAGGFQGLSAALPAEAFSLTHIGGDAILAYFVTYMLGLLIGQDIWQRVFTARSDRVAKWAGTAAGFYCLAYALAGAIIGMSAKVLLPPIATRDQVYPAIVEAVLPPGLSGLVLAAALAAIMSNSSGALIAAATVAKEDVFGRIAARWSPPHQGFGDAASDQQDEIRSIRLYLLVLGVGAIVLACSLDDILAALTLAYDILVAGLLIPIVGGILWSRGTITGALAGMIMGTTTTLIALLVAGDIFASEPILAGLGASALCYIVGSLASSPAAPEIRAAWLARISTGRGD